MQLVPVENKLSILPLGLRRFRPTYAPALQAGALV